MKLYHGTSGANTDSIRRKGLRPRGKRKSRWEHVVSSNPRAVYLTDIYAVKYAVDSARDDTPYLCIVEVETDALFPSRFCPDEDFLDNCLMWNKLLPEYTVQVRKPGVYEDQLKRIRWFRENMRGAEHFRETWPVSVQYFGTCCYFGDIPPAAISRIVEFDRTPHSEVINELRAEPPSIAHHVKSVERYSKLFHKLLEAVRADCVRGPETSD